jgi:HSP20 family protein
MHGGGYGVAHQPNEEMTMANITRRDNGNTPTRQYSRDPYSIARDFLSWDPFRELVGNGTSQAFTPRFEVKERPDAFVFMADMPGVKDDDVDISLQNGVLTISGTRNTEDKVEGEATYVYERQYGSFSRSFALPEVADPDKVEARLSNGVLTLKVGKKQEARPRKIDLKRD